MVYDQCQHQSAARLVVAGALVIVLFIAGLVMLLLGGSNQPPMYAQAVPMVMPPGWHPDPYNPADVRYWDGAQWSPHTASRAQPPPE